MKIRLSKDANCGNIPIKGGEYWVSFNNEAGEFTLSAEGKDIRLKATRRRSASKAKITSFQFFSGGGKQWSLVVQTPKHGEWVTFIEYV